MDRIKDDFDSKFRFVLLAARRAEQLMEGARPKIDASGVPATRTAMKELLDAKVYWDYGPPPEEESAAEPEVASEEAGEEDGVN